MNKKRIATFYSKMILSTVLFLGIFGMSFSSLATVKTEALTPEAQQCSEEPKKQGKQIDDRLKMSWYYSTKQKVCFYSFTENSESGIRKKDSTGKQETFFSYTKNPLSGYENSAITTLTIAETISGDLVIGGSLWKPQTDGVFFAYYAIIDSSGNKKQEKILTLPGESQIFKSGKDSSEHVLSIEKITSDSNKIVLTGAIEKQTGGLYGPKFVYPYISIVDLDGNEENSKYFSTSEGYWFADAKLYKSKYIRVSLGEYKSQSNGAEGPVKWLSSETLAEVSETEVNSEDQTTYTKNGHIKYDGDEITSYNQDGEKLKSVKYSASVTRAIPLPQQDENAFIIAEIGSTVVLKSITVNGEQGKESVDTKIGIAATDKIDFRQNGDTVSLYIIGSKGEEFLYDLDLSKLGVEKPKTEEKQPSQKNNKATSTQKDASDENKMIFFIMLAAATAAIGIIVVTIVLFAKKRRGKSDDSKPKAKVAKKVKKQPEPKSQISEPVQQQQSGYLQQEFNPYVEQPVYEEQTYMNNTEQAHYDAYDNVINNQPQYDAYGNVINNQPQYDAYGNVINNQPQYDAYGNVINNQPQYDAYGNVIEYHFPENNE